MKKTYAALLLLIACSAVRLKGEEDLTNEAGKWDYLYINEEKGEFRSELNYGMSAGELQAFRKKITDVAETLHQTPVLANPKGFTASVESCVYTDINAPGHNLANLVRARVVSEIIIRFCPLYRAKNGKLGKACDEMDHADVMLNSPKRTTFNYLSYGSDGYNADMREAARKVNEVFVKPGVIKELADGVTAYDDMVIVVANPQRPYWIQVTAGELFDLLLKYWELDAKKTGYAGMVDVFKAEKAKLSAAELKMPAYSSNEGIAKITVEENDAPYMRFNPDYFDKTPPRTHVQLITITCSTAAFERECNFTSVDYQREWEFVRQLNPAKLRGLLDLK